MRGLRRGRRADAGRARPAQALDDLLGSLCQGPATVAVIAPRPRVLRSRLSLRSTNSHRLVVLGPGRAPTARDLHAHLRGTPDWDVIIDARPRGQWRRWRELFLHLRPGGSWIVLRPPPPRPFGFTTRLEALSSQARHADRVLKEVTRAIDTVVTAPDRVVLSKRGRHLLKLRDAETPEVLSSRAPRLKVTQLAELPGGRLELRARAISHRLGGAEFDEPMDYPPLYVRQYEGRLTLVKGCVALHENTLLPDTYRWHMQDNPINKRLVDISQHWARFRDEEATGPHLPGDYYYLDYKNSGHWGHLTTEAISRLWGWPEAKASNPDLKVLLWRRPRHAKEVPERPEMTLLPAFGIDRDDIVWLDSSVTVDSLIGTSPMWHNKAPYYAHPAIRDVWHRIRVGIPGAEVPPRPRIFVTRRGGNRPCRNVPDVEEFFARRGFDVVDPAELTIAEQVAVFAGAEEVAGLAGAGMFNLIFAERLRQVLVLSHTGYDARNEFLIASVLGAETHYFWSPPDRDHPPGGWDYLAHQSAWTCDLESSRADIDAVLSGDPSAPSAVWR